MRWIRPVRFGESQPVVDSWQIPQVEDVVKLGGSGWEVFDDGLVQFQCTEGDFVAQLPYALLKWLKKCFMFSLDWNDINEWECDIYWSIWGSDTHYGVAFENRSIDQVQRLHWREGDTEDTKERDKAWIHLIPSTSCLSHGSNKAKVLKDFVVKVLPSVIYASTVQQELQKGNRLLCAITIHLDDNMVCYHKVRLIV